MVHPPASLQPILWSTNVKLLDIDRDKGYIIAQVLMYGDLEELRWLFTTYGKKTITNLFLTHPMKIYFKQPFRFIKNYILPLADVPLDEDAYVTSISGPVRQRTSGRI